MKYEVEDILKCRMLKYKEKSYLVKWRGYHDKETTWIAAKDMVNTKNLVEYFEETRARGANKKP